MERKVLWIKNLLFLPDLKFAIGVTLLKFLMDTSKNVNNSSSYYWLAAG